MSPLASLQSRIFLASALLTVLSIGVAIYLVTLRVNREAESALQSDIVATRSLVDQLRTTRAETFTMMARLVGDAPKLKAAVDTDDPPTVQDVADDYQKQLHSQMLVVTGRAGRVLARVGATPSEAAALAAQPATRDALAGRESFDILAEPAGMLQLATVPIALGVQRPDVLGALSVGFLLDDALAAQLKSVTGSDVAFGMNGRILASTLPPDLRASAGDLLLASEPRNVRLGSEDFLALAMPLAAGGSGRPSTATAVILRSRADQIRFQREIYTELAVTAVLGVMLATLLSFVVARTITRPLTAITGVMREVASTGDLARKITFRRRRWQDEDARLLATTFNTLTESIARFQREMSQKERLSSLGRLSTVIAHEVRNPLMIMKSAVRTLRQPGLEATAMREAVADIDGEVARLNRIVNEVLDFARPIRFDLSPVDPKALCRESVAAAMAAAGPSVRLDVDPSVPVVNTDGERLRLALVNLIVNARQAVEAGQASLRPVTPGGPAGPVATADGAVTVFARAADGRVLITVADAGPGIDPDDLPKIFDPYFTTKRGGTGLGLPIAKNIVEGLGGSLTVVSAAGRGTEIRLELPVGGPPSPHV
jgi:signal transduction histidine kinase